MGRTKKYFTEEEKKAAKKEYDRQRYKRLREEFSKKHSEYYQKHKEEILEKNSEWKKNNPTYNEEYYQKNKGKFVESGAAYYKNNREKVIKRQIEYQATQLGRANNLLSSYRYSDKKRNRGECTLTSEWIIENIFTSKCHYCGKTNWKELGCDRIDNSKPHTEDNVVCCCEECNKKRNRKEYNEFIKIIKEKIL